MKFYISKCTALTVCAQHLYNSACQLLIYSTFVLVLTMVARRCLESLINETALHCTHSTVLCRFRIVVTAAVETANKP